MSLTTHIGHAAGGLLVSGILGATLAAPAAAIVVPCEPPYTRDCTQAVPQPPLRSPEPGLAVEELVMGALGGAAVAGAGVGAVLALRRRTGTARAA